VTAEFKLEPGEGSPAAMRAALMQTDGSGGPDPTEPQYGLTPPPRPAPQPAPQPAAPEPAGFGLHAQSDGSFVYRAANGGQQLLTPDQVHRLATQYLEVEDDLPSIQERAAATDEFLGMIGGDQRRHQQLNALIQHWRTGSPIPADVFGIQTQAQQAPRLRSWEDEPEPRQSQTQPNPELEAMKAELASMRQAQQQSSQAVTRQQEETAAAQRETSMKSQLGAYSFLKDNPRALDAAARHATLLGRTDPRRPLDAIVREVAIEFQGIVAASAEAILRQAPRHGQPVPLSGHEGMPAPGLRSAPLTGKEFAQGHGVDRMTKRLLDFAAQRASGTQQ